MAAAPGSTLLFLHQIAARPPNTKVRFLGCVSAYDAPSATLTLSHPPSPCAVAVNISLLAPTLPFGALRDGEWVNVIGYTVRGARVDAVMLWSAAGVQLGVYEKTLKDKLKVDGESG